MIKSQPVLNEFYWIGNYKLIGTYHLLSSFYTAFLVLLIFFLFLWLHASCFAEAEQPCMGWSPNTKKYMSCLYGSYKLWWIKPISFSNIFCLWDDQTFQSSFHALLILRKVWYFLQNFASVFYFYLTFCCAEENFMD